MRILRALQEPETRQALLIAAGVWAASVPVFMAPSMAAPEPAPVWSWAATFTVSLTGLLLAPLLIWVVRAAESLPPRTSRVIAIVLMVALTASTHSVLDAWINDQFMKWFAPDSQGTMFIDKDGKMTPAPLHYYVLKNFIILLWVHAGVAAMAALSRFNWVIRRHEVAMAEARALANQAQLATIRLQLSPHFMFNTLNALSGLILTGRNEDAERMLARLSDFLRASLGSGETNRVTLAAELSAVGAYLDIESVRYDGQITVDIMCDDTLGDVVVPTFLLQPLAEQAVAYAVSPPKRRVSIAVEARDVGDGGMSISIRATSSKGPTAPPPLELAPVLSRLAAEYGITADLRGQSDRHGFSVVALLPLRRVTAGQETI